MGIAALVTWVLTAGGGFYMLATWISKGGTREPRTSKFPPALIYGHFALAAVGLILWIVYLITDSDGLAWTAFVLLIPVAALGFVMLARWIPTYRASASVGASAAGTSADAGAATADAGAATTGTAAALPEKHFPPAVVVAHGLLAVVTVVLVLLTALEVGGS